MTEDPLTFVAIPSLVSVLLHHEKEKGTPLTEQEVLSIRDGAVCVALPRSAAAQMAQARGYDDIRLEHAWEDWSAVRPSLVQP